MSVTKNLYLEQVVIKNKGGLPSLLLQVADYIEQNKLELWELLIDTEPEDQDGALYARLILKGFIDTPTATPIDLESIAIVAEQIGSKLHAEARDPQEDNSDVAGEQIAAAIRALIAKS